MGSGGVAIAALPTVICLKVPFSDGLGGALLVPYLWLYQLKYKKCESARFKFSIFANHLWNICKSIIGIKH